MVYRVDITVLRFQCLTFTYIYVLVQNSSCVNVSFAATSLE